MLTIEKTVLPSPEQWEIIIEGMRNPMNSWSRSDSTMSHDCEFCGDGEFIIGENDRRLMMNLASGGPVHAKYRRMIPVHVTINAPLYWWKEFDTYKIGTVTNSCSTMHKIHAKEFTLEDFSCENLMGWHDCEPLQTTDSYWECNFKLHMLDTICNLNNARTLYLQTGDKRFWWQMIQLLPTSYNQKRTVMLNYEVLVGIYRDRKNHKLDEWHTFCDWIVHLPYSEIITD